ncbi:MAG: tRNA adenosine(34) deaminase TadA [candidate division Zixibacteria bacterium]|nr:tRNA adenosine(34) deaminase TadA [candidate division Zixibacteria bacterium]
MTTDPDGHERWMRLAIEEAQAAAAKGEVPVGAVIVCDGRMLGRDQNRVLRQRDPTAHAEMLAIRAATQTLGYERLTGATLYATLEPCAMCAGAIVLARIGCLVYGADDAKTGACGSLRNIVQDARLNHRVKVVRGVLQPECAEMLRVFFREVRHKSEETERCESG